jgi:hypothetical protein
VERSPMRKRHSKRRSRGLKRRNQSLARTGRSSWFKRQRLEADSLGWRGRRTLSRVSKRPSRRGTTISPCEPKPGGTRRWESRTRARSRELEVPRVVNQTRSDLVSREVKARVGRSRLRADGVWLYYHLHVSSALHTHTRCKQDLIGYCRECVHARLRSFDFFGGNNKNVGKIDIILHTSLITTASASPSTGTVPGEEEYASKTHTSQNIETIDIKGR